MLRTALWVLVLAVLSSGAASAANSAQDVHTATTRAVSLEAQTQKQYMEWVDQRDAASATIRDLKAMDSWLEFQNEKYARYIRKQEEVIAELERRKLEAQRIQMELEPFLETVVDELEIFVAEDLPFLAEERRARIAFLRDSLDDYRLELSEKLRRVFEALLVETEYGRNVSASTEELTIGGVPILVRTFRLGRTALFYQRSDGTEAGVWDAAARSWRPLSPEYSRALAEAKDMADRKKAVELLILPIGAPR